MSTYVEDVGMGRRHRYGMNPVAERQRKVFFQRMGISLLIGVALFMVFMAVTAT